MSATSSAAAAPATATPAVTVPTDAPNTTHQAARKDQKYHTNLNADVQDLKMAVGAIGVVALGVTFLTTAMNPLMGIVVMLPASYVAYNMYKSYLNARELTGVFDALEKKSGNITDSAEDIRLLTKALKLWPTFVRVGAAALGVILGFAFTLSYAIHPVLGLLLTVFACAVGYYALTELRIGVHDFLISDKGIAQNMVKRIRESILEEAKAADSTATPDNVAQFDRAAREAMRRAYGSTRVITGTVEFN